MPALKNARHERFAQGLAKGLSAEEAYAAAGYKPNSGNAIRLKGNESILARVSELAEIGSLRADVSVERVLTELGRIGFSDLREAFTESGQLKLPREWSDDFAAAVSSVEVVTRPGAEVDENGNRAVEYVHKLRLWDKNSALEKIGKHLKMFVERMEHTGKDGAPLQPPVIQFVHDGQD